MERRLLLTALCAIAAFWFGAATSMAAVNQGQVEVHQTQASLEYHSKQYSACSATLRKILALDPANTDALEMLALVHRHEGRDEEAARAYEALLKKGNPAKVAVYHFELGTMLYKRKKNDLAKEHFKAAVAGKFNPGTSHFFLGVMEFNAKAWREARHHLSASLTYADGENMTPVTRYYLASAYAQLGESDAALKSYHVAEQEASDDVRATTGKTDFTSLSADIRKNALKEIKSMDHEQKFVSLSLLSQWDSNVQTNPAEVNNPVAASSQRSAKAIISAAAGYSTSPAKTFQVTPSYRFYTNYNLHYLARDYNFMSHTPSLYALYKPYSLLSTGLKAEGTFSMKNNLATADSRAALKYRPFSLTADIGPVAKYELTPRISLSAEVFWRPKKYYLDPATGDSRRTGGGIFTRLSAEFISPYSWWNPLVYLSHEWDHPAGKDYRVRTWGGGISDPLQISEKLTVTASFDLLTSDYYAQLSPKRDDVQLNFRLAGTYPVGPRWTALADVGYTSNESTISTSFKYNRFVFSGGASYSM